jgi:flagellar basal-body rod protein FlgC
MDIFNTFKIGSSALKAQTLRMNTISSNLANVETTSTPEGGPYKKKSVVFQSTPISFEQTLNKSINGDVEDSVKGVKVSKVVEDEREPRKVYDPSHPDADDQGYVSMPNVSVLEEMVDMMSATRSYQANTTSIQMAKRMAMKALSIGQ